MNDVSGTLDIDRYFPERKIFQNDCLKLSLLSKLILINKFTGFIRGVIKKYPLFSFF